MIVTSRILLRIYTTERRAVVVQTQTKTVTPHRPFYFKTRTHLSAPSNNITCNISPGRTIRNKVIPGNITQTIPKVYISIYLLIKIIFFRFFFLIYERMKMYIVRKLHAHKTKTYIHFFIDRMKVTLALRFYKYIVVVFCFLFNIIIVVTRLTTIESSIKNR